PADDVAVAENLKGKEVRLGIDGEVAGEVVGDEPGEGGRRLDIAEANLGILRANLHLRGGLAAVPRRLLLLRPHGRGEGEGEYDGGGNQRFLHPSHERHLQVSYVSDSFARPRLAAETRTPPEFGPATRTCGRRRRRRRE